MTKHKNFSGKDQIFEKLINIVSDAIFVVNSQYKIVFYNKAFEELFHFNGSIDEDIVFGEALGCRYSKEGAFSCGNSDYCEHCLIRKVIKKALSNENLISNGNRVVREIRSQDTKELLHLEFNVNGFLWDNEHYAMLQMRNL